MTLAESKQVEDYLASIEPVTDPDIFGGDANATRLPTAGGE